MSLACRGVHCKTRFSAVAFVGELAALARGRMEVGVWLCGRRNRGRPRRARKAIDLTPPRSPATRLLSRSNPLHLRLLVSLSSKEADEWTKTALDAILNGETCRSCSAALPRELGASVAVGRSVGCHEDLRDVSSTDAGSREDFNDRVG